jgi:hypothetical protein
MKQMAGINGVWVYFATNNNPALECSRAHNCRVLYMRFWAHQNEVQKVDGIDL